MAIPKTSHISVLGSDENLEFSYMSMSQFLVLKVEEYNGVLLYHVDT